VASSLKFSRNFGILFYSQLKAMRAFRQLSRWQTTQPRLQQGLMAMVRQMGPEVQVHHIRALGSGSGMGSMMDEAVEEAEAEVKIGEEVVVGVLDRRTRVASTRRGRWGETNGSMFP
jgi:hypothetical protein